MKENSKFFKIGALTVVVAMVLAACGNKDSGDPSSPNIKFYSVVFDSDGGNSVDNQEVQQGRKIDKPGNPVKLVKGLYRGNSAASTFEGWFNGDEMWDFGTAVNADVILRAKWTSPNLVDLSGIDGDNVVEKSVEYIRGNPFNEGYTLFLDENVNIKPQILDVDNFRFSIVGMKGVKTIALSGGSSGALFALGNSSIPSISVSFTLGENIILKGKEGNSDAVITINSNARFIMLPGSMITGNSIDIGENSSTNQINTAAAVEIVKGSMIMEGGKITGNISKKIQEKTFIPVGFYRTPSAVAIYSEGSFDMKGGSITGNSGGVAELAYIVSSKTPAIGPGLFSLSGDAHIGSVVLVAIEYVHQRAVKIESGWNFEGELVLHLSGNNEKIYIPNKFINYALLDLNGTGTQADDAIGRFKLGNFYNTSTSDKDYFEAISDNYIISSDGKLVAN